MDFQFVSQEKSETFDFLLLFDLRLLFVVCLYFVRDENMMNFVYAEHLKKTAMALNPPPFLLFFF